MIQKEERDALIRIANQHVTRLMEHFDSVQLVCTKDGHDCTLKVAQGGGNVFARMGSVQAWLDEMQLDCEDAEEIE